MVDVTNLFAPRNLALTGSAAALVAAVAIAPFQPWALVAAGVAAVLVLVGVRDINQTRQSIRRNYPIIGHLRFFLEFIRPEIRQYFLENDLDQTPFSRAQRSIVYQRAKSVLDKRPFGTQLDIYAPGHEWINHSIAVKPIEGHDYRVKIGGPECTQPYSASVFNISAMSFGALSANAIRALNKGAKSGGFAHDTGEGSISRHHREYGGDLIWEIGSGYFGCRDAEGNFDEQRFAKQAREPQVKMIEVKLSQGAKPGHGGVLLGPKVTPEIAEARGIQPGKDCISPSIHSAFSTPRELLAFVQRLRRLSGGKPTGFKLCVGHPWEFLAIARAMLDSGITPDFIVVDGAEGGTGAAPLEFTDHVGMPLRDGLLFVQNTLVGIGVRDKVKLGVSGKIVTGFDIARVMALGADWCNAARGFMFALGCIQAQACHTGHCPTGVSTQDRERQKALVVPDKAERVRSFHANTLAALSELVAAAGLSHPSELRPAHLMRRVSPTEIKSAALLYDFLKPGELLVGTSNNPVFSAYWPEVSADSFALRPRLALAAQ